MVRGPLLAAVLLGICLGTEELAAPPPAVAPAPSTPSDLTAPPLGEEGTFRPDMAGAVEAAAASVLNEEAQDQDYAVDPNSDAVAKVLLQMMVGGQLDAVMSAEPPPGTAGGTDVEAAPRSLLPAAAAAPSKSKMQLLQAQTAEPRPKIAVVSVCVGQDYCEVARVNFERYTSRHGYTLAYYDQTLEQSRSPHWSKIVAVQMEMQKDVDWVFWMDADSVFTNLDTPLENIVAMQPQKKLFISSDHNFYINNGHWLLKNDAWGKRLLSDWWSIYPSPRPWHDQSALAVLLANNRKCPDAVVCGKPLSKQYEPHVMLLEQNVMNSYLGTYNEGDFIVHMAGMDQLAPPGAKKRFMQQFSSGSIPSRKKIESIVQKQSHWEWVMG